MDNGEIAGYLLVALAVAAFAWAAFPEKDPDVVSECLGAGGEWTTHRHHLDEHGDEYETHSHCSVEVE